MRPGHGLEHGPVLAYDCIAGVNRWGKWDVFGQALMAAIDELSAADDKMLVFRLNGPHRVGRHP